MHSPLDSLVRREAPSEIRWGLERVRTILSELGDPHHVPAVIHVAGTNGKGSTAAFVDSVLRAAGVRSGLYTSPHLVHFAERIRIAGSPASPNMSRP